MLMSLILASMTIPLWHKSLLLLLFLRPLVIFLNSRARNLRAVVSRQRRRTMNPSITTTMTTAISCFFFGVETYLNLSTKTDDDKHVARRMQITVLALVYQELLKKENDDNEEETEKMGERKRREGGRGKKSCHLKSNTDSHSFVINSSRSSSRTKKQDDGVHQRVSRQQQQQKRARPTAH